MSKSLPSFLSSVFEINPIEAITRTKNDFMHVLIALMLKI